MQTDPETLRCRQILRRSATMNTTPTRKQSKTKVCLIRACLSCMFPCTAQSLRICEFAQCQCSGKKSLHNSNTEQLSSLEVSLSVFIKEKSLRKDFPLSQCSELVEFHETPFKGTNKIFCQKLCQAVFDESSTFVCKSAPAVG